MQPDPTNMECGRINPSKVKATLLPSAGKGSLQQQLAPLYRQAAAAHHAPPDKLHPPAH